ncbi:MAG: ATP-dependent Clp protease adaptor ClpS [Bacteroidetes bacterium]|nr:ATP-dependent Clp protease adaptor ClpS [Bacteroidota bacterium]
MVKHKIQPVEKNNESISLPKELILHNDDFNTFDFVIKTLIDVCKHEMEQAEQCALIVHYKGKCPVKTGLFAELEPLHTEMTNRGLSTTIE